MSIKCRFSYLVKGKEKIICPLMHNLITLAILIQFAILNTLSIHQTTIKDFD